MTMDSTRPPASSTEDDHFLCDDWFDPLEAGVRARIRGFIEDLLEAELDAALGRARYEGRGSASRISRAEIAPSSISQQSPIFMQKALRKNS